MREGVRNFVIGGVSIFALAGLAGLLLAFGEFTSVISRRYPVDIALNAAGGLRQGSLVELHGVPVGLVHSVTIASDDRAHPVRVRALIDTNVRIPEPAVPTVEASLLGSGARLELKSGDPESNRTFDPGNVPLLVGEYLPMDQKLLAALDERVDKLRQSFQDSQRSFDEFAKTYTEVGKNLNEMLRPLAAGDDPEVNLRTTVERMNKALTSANDAFTLARGWLSDDALRADVKRAVANANVMIERATDTLGVIGGLASNLDVDRVAFMRSLMVVMDQASAALGDVRSLLAQATSGKGTIAQLLNDAQLYQNLADSAKRLSKAMEAIQSVAEKLKAEGIILKF